jgi:hypothetical protein
MSSRVWLMVSLLTACSRPNERAAEPARSVAVSRDAGADAPPADALPAATPEAIDVVPGPAEGPANVPPAPRRSLTLDGANGAEIVALGFAPDLALYVAGSFSQGLAVGKTKLPSATPRDPRQQVFLARIRPDGTLDWLIRLGRKDPASVEGLAVAPDGSAVVVGDFVAGDDTMLKGPTNVDGFVIAVGPDGKVRWQQLIEGGTQGGHTGMITGVTVGGDGAVTVCGMSTGPTRFAPGHEVTSVAGPYVPSTDAFVARYAATGTFDWVRTGGGAEDDRAEVVTTLPGGDVVVAGQLGRDAQFGTRALPGPGESQIANPSRAFVAAYAPTGALRWATQYGQLDEERPQAIVPRSDGSVIVAGVESGLTGPRNASGFVVHLDRTGAQLGTHAIRGAATFMTGMHAVSVRLDAGALVFERHEPGASHPVATVKLPRTPAILPTALARGSDGRVALGVQIGAPTETPLGNRTTSISFEHVDAVVSIAPALDQLVIEAR